MIDTDAPQGAGQANGFWMRLFTVVVLLLLFGVAEAVLWVLTVLQLLWPLVTGGRNDRIAELGGRLADWTRDAVACLTGASVVRPFPWNDRSQ